MAKGNGKNTNVLMERQDGKTDMNIAIHMGYDHEIISLDIVN